MKLNYSFYKDIKNNNGYEAAKKIKIPTLIVHRDKDEMVPVEQSIKSSKLIKNCKFEIIQRADHRYTNPEHFQRALEIIMGFITSYFQN